MGVDIALVVVGIAFLLGGADVLVRGAASVATRFGVPPVVIGLTVVALGTSAPELAVGVASSVTGEGQVGLGNVVGSNIANVLLILGASAVAGGLTVSTRLIRLDIPLLVGVTLAAVAMGLDGVVGVLDGAILVSGLVAYLAWTARAARDERGAVAAEYADEVQRLEGATIRRGLGVQLGLVGLGVAVLVAGSEVLVRGATSIAADLGVDEVVVGLTVVAIGTSLPELATSLVAVLKGERDIAVGNVVGSNLFNLLAVLGASSIAGGGVAVASSLLRFDAMVMIVATAALLPVCRRGARVHRTEGAALLLAYVAYLVAVVIRSGSAG